MNSRQTFLLAAQGQNSTGHLPIWLMRQAGRYLPEYRQVKEQAGSFLNLCYTPELACEVTLQPLRRFELDAAIIFSDILVIPDNLGMGLSFDAGHGPVFAKRIQGQADIDNLQTNHTSAQFEAVYKAISLTRQKLGEDKALLGFCGSPWTLAVYMIEGGVAQSKDFIATRKFLFSEPQALENLLQLLTAQAYTHLARQIEAGADAVQVFDTWSSLLSIAEYTNLVLPHLQKLFTKLKKHYPQTPLIYFAKNTSYFLDCLKELEVSVLSIDFQCNLDEALQKIRTEEFTATSIQGNFDPILLLNEPKIIENNLQQTLEKLPPQNLDNYIVNLGHGILQYTKPEAVACFIKTLRQHSNN